MSRKIYDEDLRLNLILNGEGLNQGSNKMVAELGKMEQEMVKMEQEAKQLALSIKTLEKNSAANAVQLKMQRDAYSSLNQAMKAHQLQIEDMRRKVGLAGMTVEQLRNHLNALKVQLFNMPGSAGSPMFIRLQNEIRETEIRLRTLTAGASRMAQAWERLEKAANRAGTILGWAAVVIYGIVRVVTGVIDRMKELEDLVGSVRKNTNLVVGEVWDMKNAFDQWDTRTKSDDLLKMAIVAGKLGVAGKEDIMDFVDSANKIQIALGDDLNGSVEDTVNSIGKLTNAFRVLDEVDSKTGKKFTLGAAMIRTGDVLNELAKSSAASAGTILEYMTRLAGVSELAGFTIAQIGGLGSVLDALNVPSERGATALQKIILQLANPKKIQDFADAMGLVGNATQTAAEQYEVMLKKDPNLIFTTLIQKFVATKNGLVELTGGFKDFGVKGQYMTAVLGALAQNLDIVKQQQEIAAKAWKEGTSVLNEYNIMNSNFTAEILKQQKIIRAQTDQLNKDAEPAVLALVKAWAQFVVGIKSVTDWIGQHWQAIKNLTAAYLLLKAPAIWRISNLITETIWLEAGIVLEKLKIFWMKASILWTTNLSAAQTVAAQRSAFLTVANIAYTQGLRAAIVATRALSVSMYMFPWFAAIAGAVALGSAIYMLTMRHRELTETEKRQVELKKQIQNDFFTEKANLTVLLDSLKNVNLSMAERGALIKKINTEYGEYLPSLIKENATAAELATTYDLVVEALARKITFQKTSEAGATNRITYENNEAELKSEQALLDTYKKTHEAQMALANPQSNVAAIYQINQWTEKIKVLKERSKELTNEYALLQSQFTKVAPKPKLDVIIPKGMATKDEGLETFKQRQEAMKRAFEEEELAIKQHALATNQTADQENEALRQAKIRYLRMSIADRESSWRTEDSEQAAYMSARKELLDIERQSQLGAAKTDKKDLHTQLLELETKYGIDEANIKHRYLNGELETEDDYNDALLQRELLFLAAKRDLYDKGSKEWVDADNALLSKRVAVEEAMNKKLESAQKRFSKIKTDRIVNDVQKSLVLENDRWEEEKSMLEKELIKKKDLKDKEVAYNKVIQDLIEAKLVEHNEKVRKINEVGNAGEIEALRVASETLKNINKNTEFLSNTQLQTHFTARKTLLDREYAIELKDAGDNAKAISDAKKKYNTSSLAIQQDQFQAEKSMQSARIKIAQDYITALRGIVGAQSALGKALYIVGQGLAIADVWIKTAASNAAIYSSSLVAAYQMAAFAGPFAGIVAAAAPATAAAWAAPGISSNTLNAGLSTGLILAQTVAEVVQWAAGRYPVIGADDGRRYDAVYGGNARTGVYDQPTLLNMSNGRGLVGERAPELVVDGDTFRRIQLNAPELLRDIYAYAGRGTKGRMGDASTSLSNRGAIGQYAAGSYPVSATGGALDFVDRFEKAVDKMETIWKKPISVNKFGHNGIAEAMDDIARYNRLIK